MKKFFLPLIILFILPFTALAQDFQITGTVLEKGTNLPLEAATVYVEKVKDSALVTYTISDLEGNFVLEGSTEDDLRLLIAYTGFAPYSKLIQRDAEAVDLGNIILEPVSSELSEVTITANRAPVTVKNDTLEFNAASFNTRPDANLEDVMKKLPGVEVDSQGNITVNGKPVTRILVNGKEFFGNDPKIATKNLPKEIIDKIQVVDTKTKAQEFTGEEGDSENKTINITIDEDKSKGYFSRLTAGGGTDERYELSGIGNYFKDELRVSILASSNNINSSGFSFDEVFDMMGRNGGVRSISMSDNGSFSINGASFGSDGGITKSETAGVNIVNEWDGNKDASLNYFYGRNDTETYTKLERENFLPDSRYFFESENSGNYVNDSHRASATFEFEPDTLTRISFQPRFNHNDGFSTNNSFASSLDENGDLINTSETSDNQESQNTNFSSSLNFTKRFGGEGSFLSLNFSNSNEARNSENNYFSESNFFDSGITEIQDQFIDEDQKENEYELGAKKRTVLGKDLFLDVSYQFETLRASNKRSVFEFSEATQDYSIFNDLLSNEFDYISNKHIPNAGIKYEGEKWNLSTEVGSIFTSLEAENIAAQNTFKTDYTNLYLRAYARYELNKSTNIYLNYNTDTEVPNINQLQPVPNITDPLNIIVGNPELKPAYSHSFYGGFRKFDMAKKSGLFSYFNFNIKNNSVVPVTTIDEDLVRTTTYANVDGAINSYMGLHYNKRFKKEKREFRYRIGFSGNYNKNVGFTNGEKYNSQRFTFRPGITLGYEIEEIISINPSYNLSWNNTKYNFNSEREESYANHSISIDATTYWPKNVVFGNDISYNRYGNVAPGFENSSLLWNASLGYKFWKNNATLKIKVYDLLNENVSTQRMVGDDYVQDTNSLILKQYFMLSFTYKFSKFGGKDPNDGGGFRMF
ncbi:MAG TPA: outer membrane beta-barrel protein [Salinimicrobium sp.]|nr:outer membrane beta-barrel protein [Salinimicrobium sp.]